MFVDLNEQLMSLQSFDHSSIAVEDDRIDGGFLLHHFISAAAKSQRNVCIIGISHLFGHFNSACLKLGVNLSLLRNSKKVVFVEGLNLLTSGLCHSALKSSDSCFDAIFSENPDLKQFAVLCKEKLSELAKDAPVTLVIDDATALLYAGFPLSAIHSFLWEMQSALRVYPSSQLVVLGHCDADSDDVEAARLSSVILHMATLMLQVSALESGMSRDVSGQLKAQSMDSLEARAGSTRSWHFKLTDRDLKLFAAGTAPHVI